MFGNCKNLKELKINHFNVENGISINGMFRNCEGLTELDLSNFKTKRVFNISQIFKNCKNLKKLDISNFIGDKILLFNKAFLGLNKLEEIKISLAFKRLCEIFENENNFIDTKGAKIFLSDETPLKTYRKCDFNPLLLNFYIEEFDVINNTSRIIFECDFFTFEKNKMEILPLSVDI